MTVTYTAKVATCKRFGCFWKLLFVWKGSIYKLLWPNLIAYFVMYSALSLCYRFLLNVENRTTFERLSIHCQKYGELIPVSFVLGFYVTIVVSRWWDQYTSIPWPDSFAIFVSSFIFEKDDQSRLMRRTLMRYMNLSLVMVFTMICPAAKKRFPTLDHLQEAGFLLPNEKKIFIEMESRTKHPKYWLPLAWATAIVNEARRDDLIKDDFGLKTLIDEIIKFRSGCGSLLNFDWISIPLVYTQVVTLAVYTYFMATLMGNQYLDPTKGYPNHTIDLVVPIFTLLQFFFYMGWLLVAETLVNPFGEDDDDFEVNWLIDRNLQISYLIVDEVHENHPDLMKDAYWEEVVPDELPYTEAAKPTHHAEPFMGSTRYVDVPMDQRNFILMSMLAESEEMSIKTVMSGTGDRKETAPVEIVSTAKGDHNLATTSDGRKESQCSGNSVMRLLKANIYRSASSVKSMGSTGEETLHTKRFKKHSVVSATSRPFSFESVSNRKDSTDYLEDIFRMSDFSLRDSSCKVMAGRKDTRGDISGTASEQRYSLNSQVIQSVGSFQDSSRRTLNNYDVGRMTSWIENTNSPFSTSYERLGASFGGRSCSIKGQGEMYVGDLDNSGSGAQEVASPSGFERDTIRNGNVVPGLMGTSSHRGGSPGPIHGDSGVINEISEEEKTNREMHTVKEDAHEMIVPLDEQILLYSNSPSTADVTNEGDVGNETENQGAAEKLEFDSPREVENEEISTTSTFSDHYKNANRESREGFKQETKDVSRDSSETNNRLRPQQEGTTDVSEEDIVFEKPQSRAIDIPGCATESKEHRCLPVIVRDEEGLGPQEDQSSPKLEEILLSRDPLAQPQPEVACSGTSQIHLEPHEPETHIYKEISTTIIIPSDLEDKSNLL